MIQSNRVSNERQRGDYAGKYSNIIRPLCELNTHSFGFFSVFFPRLLCSSHASLSSIVVKIVLITGGGSILNKIALIRPFILRLVLLLLFKFFSSSFWACLLGTPTSKSPFCATYHANSWSNCARIANVCQLRSHCECLPHAISMRENPSRSK